MGAGIGLDRNMCTRVPYQARRLIGGKEQFYCPHIKQQSHGQYAEKRLGPARNYLSSIAVGSGANQLSGEGSVFARRSSNRPAARPAL